MKSKIKALLSVFSLLIAIPSFSQTIGNDTVISGFSMAPQVGTLKDTTTMVIMPPANLKYERILMHYALDQPPGGWDPWDRIGYVRIFTATDTFELGRIMTPYSKACSWTFDVTDFRSILADSVKLNSYILFYATGGMGYLVSVSFQFIGGNPTKEAYKVQNLWKNDVGHRWYYGDYMDPLANHIPEQKFVLDPDADSIKVKINLTGHGQGNTDNAAEFSNKTHHLLINSTDTIPHNLWRSNCASNPCSPQSGTWTYNRAGWCPGADVIPWEADITSMVNSGDSISLRYIPQAYQNHCSPTDSNCVTGVTCSDCNYNSNGHVVPWYLMQSQIVYYRNINPLSSDFRGSVNSDFKIIPNPSNGIFKMKFSDQDKGARSITVVDAIGKTVYRNVASSNQVFVDLSFCESGIYTVVVTGNKVSTKKISILK